MPQRLWNPPLLFLALNWQKDNGDSERIIIIFQSAPFLADFPAQPGEYPPHNIKVDPIDKIEDKTVLLHKQREPQRDNVRRDRQSGWIDLKFKEDSSKTTQIQRQNPKK